MKILTIENLEKLKEELQAVKESKYFHEDEREMMIDNIEKMQDVLRAPFNEYELLLLWYLRHTRRGRIHTFLDAAQIDYKAYIAVKELKEADM